MCFRLSALIGTRIPFKSSFPWSPPEIRICDSKTRGDIMRRSTTSTRVTVEHKKLHSGLWSNYYGSTGTIVASE